jgi:small conductance mechanosensitive channel
LHSKLPLTPVDAKTYIDRFFDFSWNYGPKVLAALLIFFVGLWVIRRLTRGFDIFLRVRKVDPGLRPFFTSLSDTGMKVLLVFMVANTIGIETTSFIAVFSAIAFSIGLALQGSLGNFASGVLILLFRPFKVGDLLTVSGKMGKVAEIQIFSTILVTSSGKRIIIPNGKMTEGPVENVVQRAKIQAEVSLLVQIATPLEKIRAAAESAAAKCPHILPDSSTEVKVAGLTRDDMKVQIGAWTVGEHYEDTVYALYEALKKELAEAGIELAKERRREMLGTLTEPII